MVSSIKGTFIESPNVRKVTQVSMVNRFQLDGRETKAFHQLHQTISIRSFSFSQTQAKGALICSHTIKQRSCRNLMNVL